MPIAREGQFLVTRDLVHTASLGIESSCLSLCIEEARAHPYKAVFGSRGFGFSEKSLDSLLTLPKLEAVWFWDIALENIDALYQLHELQSFGVHPKRPAIDFSRLPSLKQITWFHKPTDVGLRSLTSLNKLFVWHYLPKSKSFADLLVPDGLNELQINWANPRTLDGLQSVPTLRRLEIHRCRNLESLALLPQLFPNLTYLVVATCGRVDPKEAELATKRLPHLAHASINSKKVV